MGVASVGEEGFDMVEEGCRLRASLGYFELELSFNL